MKKKLIISDEVYSISSDDDYLKEMSDYFESDTCDIIKIITNSNDIVFDIGANIGLTALCFSSIAREVFAFEPILGTFELLKDNIKSNNNKTDIKNIGFGDVESTLPMIYTKVNRSGAFINDKLGNPGAEGHDMVTVAIETLDNYCKKTNKTPSIIKIDVEGFEHKVLNGGAEVIIKNNPICFLEMNHFCLNCFQRLSIPDFLDIVKKIFDDVYAIDTMKNEICNLNNEDEAFYVMHEHIVNQRFMNLLCSRDGKILSSIKNIENMYKKRKSISKVVSNPKGYIRCSKEQKNMYRDNIYKIEVEISNTSEYVWVSEGTHPVLLSYHWINTAGGGVFDGVRTKINPDIMNNGTKTYHTMYIKPPAIAGEFKLQVTIVQEGIGWFENYSNFKSNKIRIEVL